MFENGMEPPLQCNVGDHVVFAYTFKVPGKLVMREGYVTRKAGLGIEVEYEKQTLFGRLKERQWLMVGEIVGIIEDSQAKELERMYEGRKE